MHATSLALLLAGSLAVGRCSTTLSSGQQHRSFLSSNRSFQVSPTSIVSDACASYSTLEKLNSVVGPALGDLTKTTDFFSHYRLNLFHKTCPFWNDENGMCGNIACAVETLDSEEDIPEVWRASELGKLEGPLAKHPPRVVRERHPARPLHGKLGEDVGESCVVEYDDECDDRDYCVPEDESDASKGDYVSLLQNPERYTGYQGHGAHQVWDAIYRENCFQKSSFPHSAKLGNSKPPKGPAAMDFKAVMDAAGRQQVLEQHRQENPLTPFVAKTGLETEDECLEKRVFYRVISGMHASISTHLCWDYLDRNTGTWQPNATCYIDRLHTHPERISNLYFNYALVTRAVAKLGEYLADQKTYTFCNGDVEQDYDTRQKVLAVTNGARSVPQIFDESLMFKNGEGPSLKEDFRHRFRNVSRVMDCVGCDKCRLWGKLQVAGYGAALKVLFEFDNDSPDIPVLKRTELVALFNTYARLSNSLSATQQFRATVEKMEQAWESSSAQDLPKEPKANAIPDRAKKPHNVVVPPPEKKPASDPVKPEEVDEEAERETGGHDRHEPTLGELFNQEFGTVMKAFRIVIRSYVKLPYTLYQVLSTELKRGYQAFLGLPVSPRTWKFERPSLDEL